MSRIAALLAVLAGCGGVPARFDGGIKEPLGIDGGRLLVSARLDGTPSVLVVDTAASITALSTITAQRLGVEATSSTHINQNIAAQIGMLRSLSIGVADHADVPVAIVDMPNARDSDVKFDGILGLDVLARHDLLLDLSSRTLALHPPGTFARTPITSQMDRVDIEHGPHGLILMEVTFGDRAPIPAILDLGAPNSVVNNAAAVMLGAKRPAFEPRDLRVGSVELDTRYILIRDLPLFERLGLNQRRAMLIGSDVFENRALAIAFSEGAAFVSR
jgi:hypothetical protein